MQQAREVETDKDSQRKIYILLSPKLKTFVEQCTYWLQRYLFKESELDKGESSLKHVAGHIKSGVTTLICEIVRMRPRVCAYISRVERTAVAQSTAYRNGSSRRRIQRGAGQYCARRRFVAIQRERKSPLDAHVQMKRSSVSPAPCDSKTPGVRHHHMCLLEMKASAAPDPCGRLLALKRPLPPSVIVSFLQDDNLDLYPELPVGTSEPVQQ